MEELECIIQSINTNLTSTFTMLPQCKSHGSTVVKSPTWKMPPPKNMLGQL